MIAEILSIGTELLMGQIANTDAQYLSRQLAELGISVYHHTTVGDNPGRVKEALKTALLRSDVVITTGGLGPTEDDLTKETVADTLGLEMKMDEASREHVETLMNSFGRKMTENNLRQAYFPEGAIVMPNRRGTAPGCIVETPDGKAVAVLPGPPRELTDMFEQQLAPYLREKSGVVIVSRFLHIFGVGESNVETILSDLFHQDNPTLALYCGAGEVYARITARVARSEDAEELIAPVESEIRSRLGDSVYGEGLDTTLAKATVGMLIQRGERVSVAESLTGGMLASEIVDVPGASAVLDEAYVTYSNASKERLIGVSEATLRVDGPYSARCAREMAMGAMRKSGADWAISTTGIAGPDGGTAAKPVGLTYIAIAHEGKAEAREFHFRGDRAWIRTLACANALNLLRLEMIKASQETDKTE